MTGWPYLAMPVFVTDRPGLSVFTLPDGLERCFCSGVGTAKADRDQVEPPDRVKMLVKTTCQR